MPRPISKCSISRPGIASPMTASRPMPRSSARRMTALARLARSAFVDERPRILSTTVNALRATRAAARRHCRRNILRRAGQRRSIWTSCRAGWRRTASCARARCANGRICRARRHSRPLSAPGCRRRSGSISSATRWNRSAAFDPETQRTTGQLRALDLVPMSEVQLTTETHQALPPAYVAAFGAPTRDDPLYEAVSEGRRYPGHGALAAALPRAAGHAVRLSPGRPSVSRPRWPKRRRASGCADQGLLRGARTRSRMGQMPAGARPTSRCRRTQLYLRPRNGASGSTRTPLARITPFDEPEQAAARIIVDCGGRGAAATSRRAAATRTSTSSTPSSQHIRALQAAAVRR